MFGIYDKEEHVMLEQVFETQLEANRFIKEYNDEEYYVVVELTQIPQTKFVTKYVLVFPDGSHSLAFTFDTVKEVEKAQKNIATKTTIAKIEYLKEV